RIASGTTRTVTACFTAPSSLSGERKAELVERAQRALASSAKTVSVGVTDSGSRSFLQALADLLMRADGEQGRYIYSGRPYRLRLTRCLDRKATAYFRERRLIEGLTEVLHVSGKVRREAGGKESEFQLWIPAGSERPLPLRIEYQAKSYLRLFFEA